MSIATNELQRLLFDHITDAVVVLEARGPDFPIIEANQACRELLSDPAQPLAGEPWHAFFSYPDERRLLAIFERVSATGEPSQAYDVPYQHADARRTPAAGALSYWNWQCLPLRDDFGTIDRLMVIMADVTERQHLRRGHLINHRITAQSSLGVLVTSGPDHRIVRASARLVAPDARTADDVIGQPALVALPTLAAAGLAGLLDEVYATGEHFAAEEFTLHAPGAAEPRVWNLTILPLPGLDGAIDGLMLLAADLTAPARARRETAALAAAAQRRAGELEAVFRAIADGLFLLDGGGRIAEANEAGLRLLDVASPVRGRRLLEVLVGLDLAWEDGRPLHTGDALLAAAFAGRRQVADLILDGPHGTGHRSLSLAASPVIDGEGGVGGAIIVVRDVTRQKDAEREKDAFLSLIAHEVKSPLTAIKGFAQLARRAAGDGSERVLRHLGVIEQQAGRIGTLVDELSEANRLRKGTLRIAPVRCDLATIARAAVEQQRAATGSERIALAIEAAPLPIEADPGRIEQVIASVLANAAKYSPAGAPIAVAVGRAGDQARVAISDEGIGIPPGELAQVFDRFYRASNGVDGGFGGLGLGLYIARELVIRSGGTIRAESALGAGSTFTIALPLAEGIAREG